MKFEIPAPLDKPKLSIPEYKTYQPKIGEQLIGNRDEEAQEAREVERNIAAALAVRFESILLQVMKRTRNEEGHVNEELNHTLNEFLEELDASAHIGSSEEEPYSSPRTKNLIKIFDGAYHALRRDMGIEGPKK